MSPFTSGPHGVPLRMLHFGLTRIPKGRRNVPESTIVCSRLKLLGPHPVDSSPMPPITFGPSAPYRCPVNPSFAVQHEYVELSCARVYVYDARTAEESLSRWSMFSEAAKERAMPSL